MATQLNLQHCRDVLKEANAISMQRLDATFAQLNRNGEIVRAFKLGIPKKFSEYREYLDQYTSAANAKAQKWMDTPLVDNTVIDDYRYRQAFVTKRILQDEQGEEHTYLVQTLRRGYIETLTNGSGVNWDEARVEQVRSYPGNDNDLSDDPARYYVAKWENVSPEKRIDIVAYLEGKKTLTPSYRGQALVPHYVLYVLDATEDDGSATITLFLGNPRYKLESYSNALSEKHTDVTILHGCPRSIAQSVITAHKSLSASAEVGGQFSDGTVTLYLYKKTHANPKILENIITHRDCEYDYVTSYHWGIKDEDRDDYNIPTNVQIGWTYDKRVNSNGDGSVDITIIIAKRKYRDLDWATTFKSGVFQTDSKKQLGVVSDAVLFDISSPPAGTTYDRSAAKRGDCSSDVDTKRTVSTPIHQTITWATRFGTSTRDSFRNWVVAPDDAVTEPTTLYTLIQSLGSATNNNVSDDLNRDLSRNYLVSQSPYAGTSDVDTPESPRTVQTYERVKFTATDKKHYYQNIPVTYDVQGHTSSKDAHYYISLNNDRYNQEFKVKVIDLDGESTMESVMRTHGNSVTYTGGYWIAKRYVYRGEPLELRWKLIKTPP